MSTPELCFLCRTFDFHALLASTVPLLHSSNATKYWPQTPPSLTYHLGWTSMQTSARMFCPFCTLVWNEFEKQYKDNSFFQRAVRDDPFVPGQFWITPSCGENGTLIVTNVRPEEYGAQSGDQNGLWSAHTRYAERLRREALQSWTDQKVTLRLTAERGKIPPGLEPFFSYRIPSDINDSLRMATHWLTTCKSKHKTCGNTRLQELPTRVIDVGSIPPRLVTTNGMKGHYGALSYCWGKSKQLLLTLENLAQFQQQIPMQDLTKTGQHAVQVARAIGVQYLWIDAMCIIQNSPQDWHQEAARMKMVYKNALLVLCAADAPDAGTGMFRAAEGGSSEDVCEVQLLARAMHQDSRMWIEVANAGPGFLTQHLAKSIVTTRGWCLQESLLSRRTLYFTDKGMLWECASSVESEDGRSYSFLAKSARDTTALYRGSSIMLTPTQTEVSAGGISVTTTEDAWMDTSDPWKLWEILLHEYTKRSLTVETDVLTALAGLAEELGSAIRSRYYAGLWERDFVKQMLWRRYTSLNFHEPQKELPKPGSYRAPSWSWAAVNGEPIEYEPITMDEYELRTSTKSSAGESRKRETKKGFKVKPIFAKVVEIKTTPAGKGDFGRVSGGHVVLRSNFRTIPSLENTDALSSAGQLGKYLTEQIYPNLSQGQYRTAVEQEFEQQHVSYPGQMFALIELVRWEVKYSWNPFSPKISSGDKVSFHALQDFGVYLLVLESVQGETEAWKRVGLVKVEYSDAGDTKEYAEPADHWEKAVKEVGKLGWSVRDIKIV